LGLVHALNNFINYIHTGIQLFLNIILVNDEWMDGWMDEQKKGG
jgi:hypothetical protein